MVIEIAGIERRNDVVIVNLGDVHLRREDQPVYRTFLSALVFAFPVSREPDVAIQDFRFDRATTRQQPAPDTVGKRQ